MTKHALLSATALVLVVVALFAARDALGLDRNFAGSAQVDYFLVPTVKDANARPLGFDGFTVEAALKLSVDFSEQFSGNIKVCYGCHGFEADMAYFDYRVADELNFRFGRFSPSFGNYNLRHDPANHRLSDKPLPYDMGRMLRLRAWNLGVLPSPFPDNGLEIDGKHALGDGSAIDYAAYVVSGFKGNANAFDIDFVQSRDFSTYYVDNNGRPTYGGRLALTVRLGATNDAVLGASILRGTFDPNNQLTYTIGGADLTFRFQRTNLRFEYLARRQEFDVSDPSRLKYVLVPNGDFFLKHGAYVELEHPITDAVDLIGRVDGLYRVGNVLKLPDGAAEPADGELSSQSWIVRYTLGAAFSIQQGLRMKLSTEFWKFSDLDARGQDMAVGVHVAAVATF